MFLSVVFFCSDSVHDPHAIKKAWGFEDTTVRTVNIPAALIRKSRAALGPRVCTRVC